MYLASFAQNSRIPYGQEAASAQIMESITWLQKKPFDILKSSFSAVVNKLCKGMVIRYATRSLLIHSAVTGTMTNGICKSLNSMEEQATAIPLLQAGANITDQRNGTPNERITSSMLTKQELLLTR